MNCYVVLSKDVETGILEICLTTDGWATGQYSTKDAAQEYIDYMRYLGYTEEEYFIAKLEKI